MQNTRTVDAPCRLSDEELVAEVERRARSERAATTELIELLAELDSRKLYLGAGFPSLFAWCCEVLRLSEHGTYNRIEAARAARKFPVVLDRLRDGALNLATVRLLAPHLTPENHRELLNAAGGRSKRDVERLVAERFPQPDVPASVRKLPVARALPTPMVQTPVGEAGPAVPAPEATPPAASSAPSRRPVVAPLAPERYLISFTASAATREKLRRAQELLRHALPSGDPAEIFDRALTLLIEDVARKKLAATPRPGPSRATPAGSRHVPASVKRAVWIRDEGRCAFVGKGNRRCTERSFLEWHHVKPYAAGGEATEDNIALRCARHNAYEAELFFGPSRDDRASGDADANSPRGELEGSIHGATASVTGGSPALSRSGRNEAGLKRRAPPRSSSEANATSQA